MRRGEEPHRCEEEADSDGGEKDEMHVEEVGCGRGRANGHIDEGTRSKDGAAAEEDGSARDRGDGGEERDTAEEDGPRIDIDIRAGVPWKAFRRTELRRSARDGWNERKGW
mmetsp:Transcript_20722/g.43568  ORF Transcript_20722/g.43568 Transcript_20722/m.43568 type:complete len:111 (+) Transcript_20722:1858-2190(+)